MDTEKLEWLKEQGKKQKANNYPKISEIKKLLEQGAFLSVSYKGNEAPKAYVTLYPQRSMRIKPSTISYLEEKNIVKFSHSRKEKDWIAHYFKSFSAPENYKER